MRSSPRGTVSATTNSEPRPNLWLLTQTTGRRHAQFSPIWSRYVRGDVYQLKAPRDTRGHEQRGNRFAVVVQSDLLPLSTWLVAPTSTSARPASFRPEVEISGKTTLVLIEQIAAVDPE